MVWVGWKNQLDKTYHKIVIEECVIHDTAFSKTESSLESCSSKSKSEVFILQKN